MADQDFAGLCRCCVLGPKEVTSWHCAEVDCCLLVEGQGLQYGAPEQIDECVLASGRGLHFQVVSGWIWADAPNVIASMVRGK